jgi:hypothetical protein
MPHRRADRVAGVAVAAAAPRGARRPPARGGGHGGIGAGFDLAQLTAQLARVKSGEATFTEKRRVEMLDRTLESSGRLVFRAPDTFIRETLKPRREKLEVTGNVLTMSLGERSRTMQLDSSPRGRGHRRGDPRHAHRQPRVARAAVRDARLGQRRALVARARAERPAPARPGRLGPRRRRGPTVREVQVLLADGDRSTMTIEPLAGTRP